MADEKKVERKKWEAPKINPLDQSISDVNNSSFAGSDGDANTGLSFS